MRLPPTTPQQPIPARVLLFGAKKKLPFDEATLAALEIAKIQAQLADHIDGVLGSGSPKKKATSKPSWSWPFKGFFISLGKFFSVVLSTNKLSPNKDPLAKLEYAQYHSAYALQQAKNLLAKQMTGILKMEETLEGMKKQQKEIAARKLLFEKRILELEEKLPKQETASEGVLPKELKLELSPADNEKALNQALTHLLQLTEQGKTIEIEMKSLALHLEYVQAKHEEAMSHFHGMAGAAKKVTAAIDELHGDSLYGEAKKVLKSPIPELNEQLPELLARESMAKIGEFAARIDQASDKTYGGVGFIAKTHPNEAELFLLTRHPQFFAPENKPHAARLVAAITSLTRFINHGVPTVGDDAIRMWGQIGSFSLGFKYFKYEAMGEDNSLLAQYGMRFIQGRKELDAIYGKGFALNWDINPNAPIREKTLVEMRRGYLMVSNPELGTLLIRNSSNTFGKDLLDNAAYWSPKALSEADLQTFDPKKDDSFLPILTPSLYKNPSFVPNVNSLLGELRNVKEDIRRFKMDFEARDADENFNGDLEPNFEKLVNHLLDFPPGIRPRLAIVDPDYPPMVPYSFEDKNGHTQRYFDLTPERLGELVDRVNGTWTSKKYPQSDWVRFIETALQYQRAELILTDPENPQLAA